MTRPPRAALYARVSTPAQSTDVQLAELRELARARGWRIVLEAADTCSGARARRPGLDQVRRLVAERRLDVVAVWRTDRLARHLRELVTVVEEWTAADVALVSAREPQIDGSTPTGRMFLGLAGVFAEFERHLIRERVSAGVARARQEGVRIGRPTVRCDVTRAAELLAAGRSKVAVAAELGLSVRTLERRLGCP